jgi:L-alanine-DL-glutamate epimerase-like enolase superfamily enzyme
MTRAIAVAAERWPLERPFRISRGVKTAAEVVVVTVREDGVEGRGEGVPYPRYGESVEGVTAEIRALEQAVAEGLDRRALQDALAPGAARNALDCALWDLEAKRARRPAWALAGIAEPQPMVTAQTIGIDTAAEMGERARALASAPLIKVKLDREDVHARMRAVRDGAPRARLVVDPNEAWSVDELRAHVPMLAGLGVEMIEQPIAADDDAALEGFRSPVPLCADEACHTAADVPSLASRYAMVNVKLDKSGGLTAALELVRAASAAGLGIMVGCMVGTSLAMAPALLVAQAASVVDLDGPLLLRADRKPGLRYAGGIVHPPCAAVWG